MIFFLLDFTDYSVRGEGGMGVGAWGFFFSCSPTVKRKKKSSLGPLIPQLEWGVFFLNIV